MISVNELIYHPRFEERLNIEGYIVIIKKKLCLIDKTTEKFPPKFRVVIKNNNLESTLLKTVALYSGPTVLFHDVRIVGYLSDESTIKGNKYIALEVERLSIKDSIWHEILIPTSISENDDNNSDYDNYDDDEYYQDPYWMDWMR